jgi:hypothetical protein
MDWYKLLTIEMQRTAEACLSGPPILSGTDFHSHTKHQALVILIEAFYRAV